MCMHLCVYVHIHMYLCLYVRILTYLRRYVHIFMYLCIHVHVYMYLCIYIHTCINDIYTDIHTQKEVSHSKCVVLTLLYGVVLISRFLQIIGLFCERALSKRLDSAKETYIFKEATNHSHPISPFMLVCTHIHVSMRVCTHTHVSMHVCTHINVSMHVCTHIHLSMRVCTHIHVSMHVCTHMHK